MTRAHQWIKSLLGSIGASVGQGRPRLLSPRQHQTLGQRDGKTPVHQLRSARLGSPLLGALQSAMNLGAASNRIRITKEVRHSLLAFLTLLNDLSKNRPTYLAEIIPEDPLFLGATDRLKGALAVIDVDGCITADEGTSTL